MMRIVLFIATNIAIMLLLTIVVKVFGLDAWAYRSGVGINLTGLLVLSAVMGMSGSIISLLISKWMAKRSTGARVIKQPSNPTEAWLFETVKRQAQLAGIGMPEVAIYDAPDMNAFATGANKNNALVAVSTGLLQQMEKHEVEAVLAHEIGHVANGDMITLTLIQGVVNTFVIFFARLVGSIIDSYISGNREEGRGGGFAYFFIVMILQVVFGFFASLIVMWFSRYREFRADEAGAKFANRQSMISALQRLAAGHGQTSLPKEAQAMGISGGGLSSGIKKLFSTHPPIAERIAALQGR